MRPLICLVALVGALGCAGLGPPESRAPEARLLVMEADQGDCRFDVVEIPDGSRRTLGRGPGECSRLRLVEADEQELQALGVSQVVLPGTSLVGQGTDADEALKSTLASASGASPELWKVQGQVAWAFQSWEEGYWEDALPLLVRVGETWKVVGQPASGMPGAVSNLETFDRWVLYASFGESRLVEISTGETRWQGPGQAVFWAGP